VTLGVLQLLANHYPERLYKAYVVNAPSIFQMAWKVRAICFFMCLLHLLHASATFDVLLCTITLAAKGFSSWPGS
jgi:hypothetical protein